MRAVTPTVLLLLALGLGNAVPAQAGTDLPPEAMVRRLLEESPAVRAGQGMLAVGQAQQRRLEAGPHEWALSLEGQRRRTQMPANDPATTRDWAVGLERAWRLPGKAALDAQLGAEQRALGEANADESRQETARLLLSSWFQWLRTQTQWELAHAEQQVLEKEARSVQRRQELGDAAQLESMQSEAALAQMEARTLLLETELRSVAEQLNQLFPGLALPQRVEPGEPQALEGTQESWVEAVLSHDPALRATRLESRRSGLAAQRADKERLADPSIGLRVAREKDGEERLLNLAITIPLGGTARQADAERSQAEASIAGQREAQLLRQKTADARSAWLRAQASRQGWERSQAAARRMTSAAQLQARAYQLGESSLAELLNARRLAFAASLEARLAQLDALERRYRLMLDSHKLWVFESAATPAAAAP